MDEKILVPLDGSELAEVALPYAKGLAAKFGSDITLVYVTESAKGPTGDTDLIYLRKIAESVKERAIGYPKSGATPAIEVESVILSGHPADKIVEYAHAKNIGLIVMATHGRSGIKRWALGSVADKVIRATTRPALLIRAKGDQPEVRKRGILDKVLVPLDGSKEGEAVIPYIAQIASRLKSEVTLLQVLARGYGSLSFDVALTEQQIESDKASAAAYLNRVGLRLKEKGITVITEIRMSAGVKLTNPAEQIIRFADEKHIGITAMTTHGRSGVGRHAFGSVAERILHEGNTPLMLVRSPRAKAEL